MPKGLKALRRSQLRSVVFFAGCIVARLTQPIAVCAAEPHCARSAVCRRSTSSRPSLCSSLWMLRGCSCSFRVLGRGVVVSHARRPTRRMRRSAWMYAALRGCITATPLVLDAWSPHRAPRVVHALVPWPRDDGIGRSFKSGIAAQPLGLRRATRALCPRDPRPRRVHRV